MKIENPNKSNLNEKPWFCPGDFPWSGAARLSVFSYVSPGHVGKRASIFGDPCHAMGQGHSEVCGAIAFKASLDYYLYPAELPWAGYPPALAV